MSGISDKSSLVRHQSGSTRTSGELSPVEAAKVEQFLDEVNAEPVVMALCFFSTGEENGVAVPRYAGE